MIERMNIFVVYFVRRANQRTSQKDKQKPEPKINKKGEDTQKRETGSRY